MKMQNIQHPTSNIQHPLDARRGCHWMFDVGCWMLDVPKSCSSLSILADENLPARSLCWLLLWTCLGGGFTSNIRAGEAPPLQLLAVAPVSGDGIFLPQIFFVRAAAAGHPPGRCAGLWQKPDALPARRFATFWPRMRPASGPISPVPTPSKFPAAPARSANRTSSACSPPRCSTTTSRTGASSNSASPSRGPRWCCRTNRSRWMSPNCPPPASRPASLSASRCAPRTKRSATGGQPQGRRLARSVGGQRPAQARRSRRPDAFTRERRDILNLHEPLADLTAGRRRAGNRRTRAARPAAAGAHDQGPRGGASRPARRRAGAGRRDEHPDEGGNSG